MNIVGRRRTFCVNSLIFGLAAGLGVLFSLDVWPAMASSGHEAAATGWVNTDTYRIVCFVVLAGILYVILRKPVSSALQGRITGIKEELSELEARKIEAETKLKEYQEKFALLAQEGREIVDAYIVQGKEAQARIIAEAKVSAEKLETGAKRQIENAFEQAKAEIHAAVLEKAMEKAEASIRAGISREDQNRLVDEYLEKVTLS